MLLLLLRHTSLLQDAARTSAQHVVVASFSAETQHLRPTCKPALNYLRFMVGDEDEFKDPALRGTSGRTTCCRGGVDIMMAVQPLDVISDRRSDVVT